MAERPLWDWGLHFPSDIFPIRQATRVHPGHPRGRLPNLVRNPRAIVQGANLARRADLRAELEELKRRGVPVTVIWGDRDGIIPKESLRGAVRRRSARRAGSSTAPTRGCWPTPTPSAR